MVDLRTSQYGVHGATKAPERKPHLIVFTSDEERTEIPMDLTAEEARLLVDMARSINKKAKWSADIRMELHDPAPTGEVA